MYTPDVNLPPAFVLLPVVIYVVGVALGLLLLYGVIRVGVFRGMRDYHRWAQTQHSVHGGPDGTPFPPITPQQPTD